LQNGTFNFSNPDLNTTDNATNTGGSGTGSSLNDTGVEITGEFSCDKIMTIESASDSGVSAGGFMCQLFVM
jgi:hypothetical protein